MFLKRGSGQLTAWAFLVLAASFIGCDRSTKPANKFKSLPGYDLTKPKLIKLPLELDEISGLSYYAADSSIFAISDDRGAFYKIWGDKKGIKKFKFSHGADFEDVVFKDSIIYILQSNGDIFEVSYNNGEQLVKVFNFPYDKQNEFEILYSDTSLQKLILICKDCESDKKKELTSFTFDPKTGSYNDSSFKVNVKSIDKIFNTKGTKFKPSAAAINPANGDLYIISSINQMIIQTDLRGTLKNAVHINPKLFKQPEGMTFTTSGDMIISNEFAETGTANLLIFPYSAKGVKP